MSVQPTELHGEGVTLKYALSIAYDIPILGKPTVDETGIPGAYNMQVAWRADRAATVTADLRDRFGLELSGARRTMDTLVVDAVHPDRSLVLLTRIGRATKAAPLAVRRQLARFVAVH